MSSITHTLLDVNRKEWKNPNDSWCVTCTLVCLFFVCPDTWVALKHFLWTIFISFSISTAHIFVISAEVSPRRTINSSVVSTIHTWGQELLNPSCWVARFLSPTPSGAHYGAQKRRLSCFRINFRPKQWTSTQHQAHLLIIDSTVTSALYGGNWNWNPKLQMPAYRTVVTLKCRY